MRIAISVTANHEQASLDERFGRCPYFQIIEEETDEVRWIDNAGLTAEGGAGIAAAQQLIDEKVELLITGKLGPHAWGILNKSDIRLLEASPAPVSTILQQYQEGALSPITGAKKGGRHGHGHGQNSGQKRGQNGGQNRGGKRV